MIPPRDIRKPIPLKEGSAEEELAQLLVERGDGRVDAKQFLYLHKEAQREARENATFGTVSLTLDYAYCVDYANCHSPGPRRGNGAVSLVRNPAQERRRAMR